MLGLYVVSQIVCPNVACEVRDMNIRLEISHDPVKLHENHESPF